MIRIRCLLIFLLFSLTAYGRNDLRFFSKKADAFFHAYVKAGKVDYISIRQNSDRLKILLSDISSIDPGSLREKELEVYLVNVYNIFVIDQVLRFYPLKSPFEIPRFFTRHDFNMGGRYISLNEMKDILMSKYSDLRIFCLLCNASLGSPILEDHSYKLWGLNRKLNKRIKNISNDRNFVRLAPKSSLILLSEIFHEYENYFGKEKMIGQINKFRMEKLPSDFEIRFFPENCNLNIK